MVDDVVNWTVLLTTTCAQSVSFPPCCGAKYFISKCNNVCGGVSCFSVCQWRLPRHDAFLLYSLVYLFCYSISAVTVFHQFLLHYNNFTAIAILCGFFYYFYRAMHFSANARSWDRMSSVCPSVCNTGDL